ncbi:hypothetical protein FHS07_001904 [Microbacterium proteolyticum]|uniref:Uncharacterized protein n=1 Tax=Microbacterium proteolyticum TaxID=1572644 RepID=A0A7W5CIA0_9MICO|nr:hypothetical protein [Microbacterium proteolyticum]MBB3158208.1 hypothetical protein [Microbacterium proteolyticum]
MTDARRQALQALVASAVSLLVVLGAVTDAQSSALLDLSASGLLAVQGALGLILLRAGDRFTWLNTNGRGAIYALGGAIGAAGFAFSLFSAETSSLIVQVATVVASILVGALQIVNAGTLAAPHVGDLPDEVLAQFARARAATTAAEAADAERAPEESAATFGKEREPEWVAPLTGLHVGVFWPGVPHVDREAVTEAAKAAIGSEHIASLRIMFLASEFRGLSLDVVLVTIPLTRNLIEVFEPNLHGSSYDGDRVQYLEVD